MHGKTWYGVSVVALMLALVFSLAVAEEAAVPTAEQKEQAIEDLDGDEVDAEHTAGNCILCYTCGDGYPRFRGSISSGGRHVYERWAGCSGVHAWRHDNNPYLCCNR
jgi:hypothetical protein